jgi:hypothetical protein
MFETFKDDPHSVLPVLVGFLLGLLIDLGSVVLSTLLGLALRVSHAGLFPAFNALFLIVAAGIAIRRVRESGLALGVVFAVALALLLDAACGAAISH